MGEHVDHHRAAGRALVRIPRRVAWGLKDRQQLLDPGCELSFYVCRLTCGIAAEGRDGAAVAAPVAMLPGDIVLDELGEAQAFCPLSTIILRTSDHRLG
jgi:hypothetical protein